MLALVAVGVVFWLRRPAAEAPATPAASAEFIAWMTRGNGLLEKGEAHAAVTAYDEALRRSPASIDVRLNLANAYLRAERPEDALAAGRKVLELDPNSAAAYYLVGCAHLRLNQFAEAAAALQQSWRIDPTEPAVDFQMGLAQKELGQIPDAIRDFENVVKAVPDHPSAHYQLSQLYRRVGRAEDAAKALAAHQNLQAKGGGTAAASLTALERSKYSEPLAPFVLAQPEPRGIPVQFVEASTELLDGDASGWRGPVALLPSTQPERSSLFVQDRNGAFVLLDWRDGKLVPQGRPLRVPAGATYHTALTGDLDNDGFEDVVAVGLQDTRVFKFYAEGRVRDATRAAGLEGVKAAAGWLADLDFSGNLDLLVVPAEAPGLVPFRNLGNLSFDGTWADSGLPAALPGATQVFTEDWNNEGLPGVFVARAGGAPRWFAKPRSAPFAESQATQGWPAGAVMVTGDLDNDLRAEAVIATTDALEIVDREQKATGGFRPPLAGFAVERLTLLDYDNDGWLDLVAAGPAGLRVWRNGGLAGWLDTTSALGLAQAGAVTGFAAADVDADGDTDLVTTSEAGLRVWRNDGGNQNQQLKLRLVGKRSNRSALGVRIELVAGNWRTSRVVRNTPLEVGVGRHQTIESLKFKWFDLATAMVEVPVIPGRGGGAGQSGGTPASPAPAAAGGRIHVINEPTLPSGSCPYLYAWDGRGFRFVSDILGAAPLGLPINREMFVAADPEEFLVLGNALQFPPRDGAYEIRITDELREVLYLDQAKLVAVDHPAGTLVYPTSRMVPKPPFPKHELWTLRPLTPLRQATRSDGLDVTAALAEIDQRMVEPVQLRRDQLRGLAERYAFTMDFGTLPVERPLVLALTGWIHFGGGMANISGSLDPTLPFPFPSLEVERADGTWQPVEVTVGTPAGKTKTILIDLEHKLPAGARRLRLSMAYELYWDRALLAERARDVHSREYHLDASRSDLRWRGYSRYADLPPSLPRTPKYDDVVAVPPWAHTPSGWFTRYGAVDKLIGGWDDKLALLAGGDELALSFDADRLPPVAAGMERHFFLYVVGWDKDADYHVEKGWQLEPLPWRGMNDQHYGEAERPAGLDDGWIKEYNTRWVDLKVVSPGGKVQAIP